MASEYSSASYMAKLGSFYFALDTAAYQTLERTSSYRWSQVDRIGRKPASQYTGRDAETITLNGTIYPHFMGGLGQIDYIRQMAAKGDPLLLVMTDTKRGQNIGYWVVKELREKRSNLFDTGAPRKIEFTITIAEYGEDA